MTASTMTPHSRPHRLVTLDRLATAASWVFWLFAILTSLQVALALTRTGSCSDPRWALSPARPRAPGSRSRHRCCGTPAAC
jgi:hypothetical protein